VGKEILIINTSILKESSPLLRVPILARGAAWKKLSEEKTDAVTMFCHKSSLCHYEAQ
jgi:hypothetical protein